MINEFRYGQIWKIWSSPLSLSLYNTFKSQGCKNEASTVQSAQYWLTQIFFIFWCIVAYIKTIFQKKIIFIYKKYG